MARATTSPTIAWVGDPPAACDLCGQAIRRVFVDGRTARGPWACMCVLCHSFHGVGLGTGRGQRFERDAKIGQFVKVEG